MTLPLEPKLNPPEFDPIRDREQRQAERDLLRFKLTNACQHAINAIALIASDDDGPAEGMTWEEAQEKMCVIMKAVQDIDKPLVAWTYESTESEFWANKLKGAP